MLTPKACDGQESPPNMARTKVPTMAYQPWPTWKWAAGIVAALAVAGIIWSLGRW